MFSAQESSSLLEAFNPNLATSKNYCFLKLTGKWEQLISQILIISEI